MVTRVRVRNRVDLVDTEGAIVLHTKASSDQLLELLNRRPRICRHVHVPLG
jgi:tRNA A37 methylthiotransferase MiaB